MSIKLERIKKVINKVSLYTLCSLSLPFFAYTSSFEIPKIGTLHATYPNVQKELIFLSKIFLF